MASHKPIPSLSPAQIERFWTRVGVQMYDTDACWEWTGRLELNGYARVRLFDRKYYVHRVAYTLARGPIPDGLTLDHLCRNRRCANPGHLEAVTGSENTLRGTAFSAINAKKTHCPRGHKLVRVNGQRTRPCLECRRLPAQRRWADRYARRRASGLCVQCGVAPSVASRCEPCRDRHNQQVRARRVKS